MKQNFLYLLKGLLFSLLIAALSVFLLALVMMKTGWGDSIILPLLIAFFCLSVFLGSRYFAKHAESRRFLWGIAFGAACFVLYVIAGYCLSSDEALLSDNVLTYLTASLCAGCLGGMLS